MRNYLSFCFLIVFTSSLAQQVQWAGKLIDFSSEYRDNDIPENSSRYRAAQVLGYPNTMKYGKSALAWAPGKSQAGKEHVTVGFNAPQTVQQVIIGETLNSGAVAEIILYDNSGKKYTVYENSRPAPTQKMNDVLTYFKIKPVYNVVKLKLILNTDAIFGMQQIDCIGISSAAVPYKQQINVIKYNETVGLPENLGPNVNSEYYDHLPMISPDGTKLYFTRKFAEENTGKDRNDDIYYSYIMPNGKFSKAENIGPPLNNDNNNFICFISSDNNKLYTANKYLRNTYNFNGLSQSVKQKDGSWSKPKPLNIPNLVNNNEFAHYHLSLDENTALLAIQRPDSYGDLDLYVSQKYGDGSWSEPKNLGPVINTPGSEGSVFLAADGKTLYFSSSGHPGFGSYDMYMSKRLDNTWTNWSKPLNLGDKINSDEMDIYYTIPASGDYAYFSSGKSYFGLNDLFRIKLPKEIRPEPVDIIQFNTAVPLKKEQLPVSTADVKLAQLKEQQRSTTPVPANQPKTNTVIASPSASDDIQKQIDALKQQQQLVSKPSPTVQQPVSNPASVQSQPVVKKEVVNTIQPYQAPAPAPKVLTREELAAREKMKTDPFLKPEDDALNRIAKNTMPVTVKPSENAVQTNPAPPATNYILNEVEPQSNTTAVSPVLKTSQPASTDDLQQRLDALKKQQTQMNSTSPVPVNAPYQPASKTAGQYPNPTAPVPASNVKTDELQQRLDALKQQQREVGQSTKIESYPWQPKPYDPQPAKEKQDDRFADDYDDYQSKLEALKQQQKAQVVAPVVKPETEKEVFKPVPEVTTVKPNQHSGTDSPVTATNPIISKYEEKLRKLQEEMARIGSPERQATNLSAPVTEIAPVQEKPAPVSPPVTPKAEESLSNTPTVIPNPEIAAVTEPESASPEIEKEKARLDSAERAGKEAYTQLSDMLDKLGNSKQDLEKDITELQQQRTQYTDEKEKLYAQTSTLESEKSKLEAEKKRMDDLLQQMQAERDKLAAEKLKMEQDKAKLDALKKQQEREVLALKRSIDSLSKVQQLATVNTQLQQQYDLFSVPLEVGAVAQVNNIYFVADAAYLQIPSYTELDKVVAFLFKNPKLKVEIGGHTNGLCDESFCQKLSSSRAKTCVDYLIKKGIAAERLSYKGYGKAKLLFPQKPENPLNQRVEIKILSVE
jgi:outer membrane protein OmpA-like peptidoglycan-associated protein